MRHPLNKLDAPCLVISRLKFILAFRWGVISQSDPDIILLILLVCNSYETRNSAAMTTIVNKQNHRLFSASTLAPLFPLIGLRNEGSESEILHCIFHFTV